MTKSIDAKLKSGRLARLGLCNELTLGAAKEKICEIAGSDVDTLRLVFPDQHGILRGKTIVSKEVSSVLSDGIGFPSTLLLKDTSHRTVFPVWEGQENSPSYLLNGALDVIASPDIDSLVDFDTSSNSMLLICDLYQRDGSPIHFSSRQFLKNAVSALKVEGFSALFGLEVEFQIFKIIDMSLEHQDSDMPAAAIRTQNITQGWQYLTETKYGEVEEILLKIKDRCDQMSLGLKTMEIEMGPSQFEFTFGADEPLKQADKFVLFRSMVKEECRKHKMHATFMAKPIMPNSAANGWHIHQSLIDLKTERNAFAIRDEAEIGSVAKKWIAGLLHCATDSCLLTTPTINGYKRYQPNQLAPTKVNWGSDNRGAMLRSLIFDDDPNSRIENRVAESAANPYFALASQIMSGLYGLKNNLTPPNETKNPYADSSASLPNTLGEAISIFKNSKINCEFYGEDFVDYLTIIKEAEWKRYNSFVSQWEQDEYFNNF